MHKLVYIVDDEKDIRELLKVNLKKYGFLSREFIDGKSFLRGLERNTPDLIILDLMLPGIDGIEITKILKKENKYQNIPIIMLTAKSDETDKILGLELGADDYVTKPFSPKELIARIKAVLRRKSNIEKEDKKNLQFGPIKIDLNTFQVFINSKEVNLTLTEFKILEILIRNKNRVCSRDFLLENLWGNEKIVIDRTIDVHIKHLRDKLGAAGNLIKNLRGIGYKIINEK